MYFYNGLFIFVHQKLEGDALPDVFFFNRMTIAASIQNSHRRGSAIFFINCTAVRRNCTAVRSNCTVHTAHAYCSAATFEISF